MAEFIKRMRVRHLLFVLGFALVVFLGYWIAHTATPQVTPRKSPPQSSAPAPKAVIVDEELPKFRRGERLPVHHSDEEALLAGALQGQRILVFKDQAALTRFLERAGDKIRLMGRLDALNALRIGFSDYGDLASLLDGDEEESFVFPVISPSPGEGSVQPGAVALGSALRAWLGITGDNSDWGMGVRIAVLDTGVAAHSAFSTSIRSINLVGLPSDPTAMNGHGTAVASVIIGNQSLTPGVAPGADIISVRIANDNGTSDSFLLAQGIVAAVDAGANLINISMGSFGDSVLVRNAIEYAAQNGVLIVAAAGNNGINQVAYPAANDGVIAVGSVDAIGSHLDFSNSGSEIDIAAPGYGVNAAWTENQAVSVSGTSFSSPIVAGAIAAIMTEAGTSNLTASQAWKLLSSYLNDGGTAGDDSELGAGMPDIGRVLAADTPGIYDAAVASTRVIDPTSSAPNGQVEVLVQNRGTETLINTTVKVSTGAGIVSANITTLAPNAVQTVRVPITQASDSLIIDSSVTLSSGLTDVKPTNNRRVDTYAAKSTP